MLLDRALFVAGCSLLLVAVLMVNKAELVPLSEFYPYGNSAGDTALNCTLEERRNGGCNSSLISIGYRGFRYAGARFTGLYVNGGGFITLDSQSFLSFNGTIYPDVLVPYYTTTGVVGDTWYRDASNSTILLTRARDKIRSVYASQGDFQPNFLFIVTWFEVGSNFSDPELNIRPGNNTFQALMVSDGQRSFVFFLYADGRFGHPSEVIPGFFTPFQVYRIHPPSEEEVVDLTLISNIGIPGAWVFRVDPPTLLLENCNNEASVSISPTSGNMLGGTPLFISGPCFNIEDDVQCMFEGSIEVAGIYIDEFTVVCVTPYFPTRGRKDLTVTVWSSEGMTLNMIFSGDAVFEAVSFEELADVSFNIGTTRNNPSLHLVGENSPLINITWDPQSLFLSADPSSYRVNISLHRMNLDDGIWELVHTLSRDEANDGHFQTTINQQFDIEGATDQDLHPVVVEVTISSTPSLGSAPIPLRGLVSSAKRWSSVFFYSFSDDLMSSCENWCLEQPEGIDRVLLSSVPPCPRTVWQARAPNSGVREDRGLARYRYRDFFHVGADTCFRQSTLQDSSSSQQCCYGPDGFLVVGAPGGGSVDRVSPEVSIREHYIMDVLPALFCCLVPGSNCERYYEKRPSDNGADYNPPPPACVYGDPHIITLDGFKYTFNGAGEYTLVETEDGAFTLQGRMVQPLSTLLQATAFSAIAAKEAYSDTVQIQISGNGNSLEVLVNREILEIFENSSRAFRNVTVSNLGNDAIAATFSSGVYIEARGENGIVSTLITSFSMENYQGQTRGLMGNFNGDTSDDLTPRGGGGRPVSLAASLEDIHNMFGRTWIVNSIEDSIFTYSNGFSFSSFYLPNYTPAFSPTFSDPGLETEANEVCMGDTFCLFDVAATGSVDIGLSTLVGGLEFENIANISLPVSCSPPCENGVCVSTNLCSCSAGYQGNGCSDPVFTQCDVNPCNNGGTCRMRAGSYICSCPRGFSGILCQIVDTVGSGSGGSGGGGGDVGVACDCQRDVECSVVGSYTPDRSEVFPTSNALRCVIGFSDASGVGGDFNAGMSTGSGDSTVSSISIDPTFDPSFLSSGSYSFLRSVGVISRDEGTSMCTLQGALNSESLVEILELREIILLYQNEDGVFDDVIITMESLRAIIDNRDFTIGGQLSEVQQCSFQYLLATLVNDPAFVPFSCRDTTEAEDLSTILAFTVLCGM